MESSELMTIEQVKNAISLGAALLYFLTPTMLACIIAYGVRRTLKNRKIKKQLKQEQEKKKRETTENMSNGAFKPKSMELEFNKDGEIKANGKTKKGK